MAKETDTDDANSAEALRALASRTDTLRPTINWSEHIAAACREYADAIDSEDIADGLRIFAEAVALAPERDPNFKTTDLLLALGPVLRSRIAFSDDGQRAMEQFAQAIALGGMARAALHRLPAEAHEPAMQIIKATTLND